MSVRTPKYRLHKASGQALVQINGQRIYLGVHGSEESEVKYKRLIAEWLTSHRMTPPKHNGTPVAYGVLTVNELILAYLLFAES